MKRQQDSYSGLTTDLLLALLALNSMLVEVAIDFLSNDSAALGVSHSRARLMR
jgi:hypothetical protein